MDFQTMEKHLRDAEETLGHGLVAIRPCWLKDAADMATYCCATMFESDFIGLDDDDELWYSNDCIDSDETREATDFLLFEEIPYVGYSADGKELVTDSDPIDMENSDYGQTS